MIVRAVNRNSTYPTTVRLVVWECPSCGIVYGIPETFADACRESGQHYYCPNGHSLSWAETAEQKQRDRADRAERRLAQERDARQRATRQRDEANRSRAALKGALTKAKRRAGAGMCPVQGCQRHFQNLKRHVDRMHPEVMKELQP